MENKELENQRLFYRWTGCACTAEYEREVTPTWGDLHPIYGWDENLAIIGEYSLHEILRELLAGKKELRIQTVCPNCLGTAEDVYYLKP
jgi:hypothetical protein